MKRSQNITTEVKEKYFLQGRILLRKFSKKIKIYIYNIVITVVLQMGYTLYIIKIIVSIMNINENIIVIDNN